MKRNRVVGLAYLLPAWFLLGLAGCSILDKGELMPPSTAGAGEYRYHIAPGDHLDIFVWRNEDLSVKHVPVRPDGLISVPLAGELHAGGKTTQELAGEIEKALSEYIREPLVTVTVSDFKGGFAETVRVVGEAAQPRSIPYQEGMTLLDVMIAAGGLTEFADGNKASIVRMEGDKRVQKRVRLDDLIRDGDISANVEMAPGDILIIPEAWF